MAGWGFFWGNAAFLRRREYMCINDRPSAETYCRLRHPPCRLPQAAKVAQSSIPDAVVGVGENGAQVSFADWNVPSDVEDNSAVVVAVASMSAFASEGSFFRTEVATGQNKVRPAPCWVTKFSWEPRAAAGLPDKSSHPFPRFHASDRFNQAT